MVFYFFGRLNYVVSALECRSWFSVEPFPWRSVNALKKSLHYFVTSLRSFPLKAFSVDRQKGTIPIVRMGGVGELSYWKRVGDAMHFFCVTHSNSQFSFLLCSKTTFSLFCTAWTFKKQKKEGQNENFSGSNVGLQCE